MNTPELKKHIINDNDKNNVISSGDGLQISKLEMGANSQLLNKNDVQPLIKSVEISG